MPPKKREAAKRKKDDSELFEDVVFSLDGELSKTPDELEKLIEAHGGSVTKTITAKVTHLITTDDDFEKPSAKVKSATTKGITILNENFIHDSIAKGEKAEEENYNIASKNKGGAKKQKTDEAAETTTVEGGAEKVDETTEKKDKKKADAPAEDKKEKKIDDGAVKVKLIRKGKAPVEPLSGCVSSHHVLEVGDTVYDCMLNQTNIGHNNNKYYQIQVLEADAGKGYIAWNRWGRVGEPGQNSKKSYSSQAEAIRDFTKKFSDKTQNKWDNRDKFTPVTGKYTLLEMDYGVDEEKPSSSVVKRALGESSLDSRVQKFIKLICDIKMMASTMVEMEYDIKKMPLGKLSKSNITKGYLVLKEIEDMLKKGYGGSTGLSQKSSEFYTLIPHSFGRRIPPVINSIDVLKSKMTMLETLTDIEIATKLIKEAEETGENPIDSSYKKLKADLVPVNPGDEDYKMVEKYIKNTHEKSTPKIAGLFKVLREGEKEKFDAKKHLGNRRLLWHGSRLTNYVGIISQGLRIAPPEAPVSGYRFGKGIYFADVMSLSSKYCRTGGSNDFVMILLDVALGKTCDLLADQYMEKSQPGTDSTFALGSIAPDPKDTTLFDGDVTVPYGKLTNTGVKSACYENQFIVYDTTQCHMKFIVHLNWT